MPGKLKTRLENQGSQGGSRRPEPRAPSAPGGLSAGGCLSPPIVAPGRPRCRCCLPLPSGGSLPRSRGHQLQAEVISDLCCVRGPCPGDCPHPGGGLTLATLRPVWGLEAASEACVPVTVLVPGEGVALAVQRPVQGLEAVGGHRDTQLAMTQGHSQGVAACGLTPWPFGLFPTHGRR